MMKTMNTLHIAVAIVSLLLIFVGRQACAEEAASESRKRPTTLSLGNVASPGHPTVCVDADCDSSTLPWLSWDTEGGDRTKNNLLRAGVSLKKRTQGQLVNLAGKGEKDGSQRVTFQMAGSSASIAWTVGIEGGRVTMQLSGGAAAHDADRLELVFHFNPGVTPTTVLPSQWADDGSVRLPAVLSAPDFGQMLLAEAVGRRLVARSEGNRDKRAVDFVVTIPALESNEVCTLTLSLLILPPPKGLQDKARWEKSRRGWFGAFQPSAAWGDQSKSFSAPVGMLANNVISDTASCSLWFYADQALWTPQVATGISVATLVRRTLDWWLDHRTRPTGEVICYWDYGNFLDANAGPLVAAWDYVEATGDTTWLKQRIERLEFISEFLAKRDMDGDGMVEAVQSGNRKYAQAAKPLLRSVRRPQLWAQGRLYQCPDLPGMAVSCRTGGANRAQQEADSLERIGRSPEGYLCQDPVQSGHWLAGLMEK